MEGREEYHLIDESGKDSREQQEKDIEFLLHLMDKICKTISDKSTEDVIDIAKLGSIVIRMKFGLGLI